MDGAGVIAMVMHGVVQDRTIVPHDQVTSVPLVSGLKVRASRVFEQKVQQALALGGAPAFELGREGTTYIESVVAPVFMATYHRVY